MIKKPSNFDYWIKYSGLQHLLTLLLFGLVWNIFNSKIALAVLAGGLTSCFSNLIFAGWFFSIQGVAQKSKKILSAFYIGEGLKIFFTALLFAVTIGYLHLSVLPLLLSYLIIHLSSSFIALLRK